MASGGVWWQLVEYRMQGWVEISPGSSFFGFLSSLDVWWKKSVQCDDEVLLSSNPGYM